MRGKRRRRPTPNRRGKSSVRRPRPPGAARRRPCRPRRSRCPASWPKRRPSSPRIRRCRPEIPCACRRSQPRQCSSWRHHCRRSSSRARAISWRLHDRNRVCRPSRPPCPGSSTVRGKCRPHLRSPCPETKGPANSDCSHRPRSSSRRQRASSQVFGGWSPYLSSRSLR